MLCLLCVTQTQSIRNVSKVTNAGSYTPSSYCVHSDKRGFLHPIILSCPQRQTWVLTPHHLIVSHSDTILYQQIQIS